jgi:hypothetical protein
MGELSVMSWFRGIADSPGFHRILGLPPATNDGSSYIEDDSYYADGGNSYLPPIPALPEAKKEKEYKYAYFFFTEGIWG